MNKKEIIFNKIFYGIKDYMNLHIFNINYVFIDTLENYSGRILFNDSNSLSYTININNDIKSYIFYNNIDSVIKLLIHEFCHIFTSQGGNYFLQNKQVLVEDIGLNKYNLHYKQISNCEEMYTNMIDSIIYKGFIKTKLYKNIKKELL